MSGGFRRLALSDLLVRRKPPTRTLNPKGRWRRCDLHHTHELDEGVLMVLDYYYSFHYLGKYLLRKG